VIMPVPFMSAAAVHLPSLHFGYAVARRKEQMCA
jgi:hypothetical protein